LAIFESGAGSLTIAMAVSRASVSGLSFVILEVNVLAVDRGLNAERESLGLCASSLSLVGGAVHSSYG